MSNPYSNTSPRALQPTTESLIKILSILSGSITPEGALKITLPGGVPATPTDWGDITGDLTDQADLISYFANYILATQLGAADGVATLGADSKLTGSQIPTALLGDMKFMGFWDATANTTDPDEGALVSGTPAPQGQFWVVTTPGATSLSGVTDWKLGDWVVSLGATWGKVDNTDAVISVAGKNGIVTLELVDIVGLTAALAGKTDTGHNHALSALSDVVITGIANGQSIVWDTASGKWINATPAAGGGGGADMQEVWMNTGF